MNAGKRTLTEYDELKELATEIRGILDSLANDEPIRDAIRREERFVRAEIEQLHRKHHPYLLDGCATQA